MSTFIPVIKTFLCWAWIVSMLIMGIKVVFWKWKWNSKEEGGIVVVVAGLVYPAIGLALSTQFPISWEAEVALGGIFCVTLVVVGFMYVWPTKNMSEVEELGEGSLPLEDLASSSAAIPPVVRAPSVHTSSIIAFALEAPPRGGGNDLDRVLVEPGTRLVFVTPPEGCDDDVDPLGSTLVHK